MTIYDPTSENVFMPPHVKSDSPGTQTEEDMALETSQLMIRSPDQTALAPSSQDHTMSIEQPYKKFRYDPWSVEYLCSDPTSPLANIPLEVIKNKLLFFLSFGDLFIIILKERVCKRKRKRTI